MSNLKPCPFCGSNNVEYNREHISGEHRVECPDCNLAVLFDVDLTDEQAIAAWNRRADRWIPVERQYPNQGVDVLVITSRENIFISRLYNNGVAIVWLAWTDLAQGEYITHWQPISPAPGEDD